MLHSLLPFQNEMYNAGDILRRGDLVDPTSARLSQVFRRVVHLVGLSRSVTQVDIVEDYLILMPLLKVYVTLWFIR